MQSTLRSALFIARHDLGAMLRQKETILWVFAMPFLFFYFIGTITAGAGGGSQQRSADPDPLVLDEPSNGGALADELVRRLELEGFSVERVVRDEENAGSQSTATEPAATRLETRRRLTIPSPTSTESASFTQSCLAGVAATLDFRPGRKGQAGDLERLRVSRAVYGIVADLALGNLQGTVESGQPPDFEKIAETPRTLTLAVESAGHRRKIPTGFEQAVPGTMVMFTMLVLLTTGGVLLVIERQNGLLRRLAVTPISPTAIVSGKWIARVSLGLVQVAFAMLMSTLVFGMDWGSQLLMVCAVLLAWAAFNASLAILLGNLARTESQVVGLGVLSSNVLAALGGCWWPIEVTPDWMQSLALCLPTGWAMNALHRLVSFNLPAASALPHLLALTTATLIIGVLGVRTFRYE